MSWLFSQVLVAEYWGENYLDGEQSVPLSGSNTQQAYCAPDKMTDFYRVSQFGMTFKPLTENLGEELLTLYLGGFPVRTSPLPDGEPESTGSAAECGSTWRVSLGKYDLATSSWKTAQCWLLEDLEQSLATFPRCGTTVDGALYPLPTLVRPMSENESGFWLTPNCMDALPPRSPEALQKQYENNRAGRTTHSTLREQVVYPPPARMFPTPQASDNRDRGNLSSGAVKRRMEKGKQIGLAQSVSQESGQLNPMWVEWLMGWPLGWTDLKPLEMDKFLVWRRQHSACSDRDGGIKEAA